MVSWQNINKLMEQEINRKEFLRYIGIAVLGLIGVTTMMSNLNKALSGKSTKTRAVSSGYGGSAYGA